MDGVSSRPVPNRPMPARPLALPNLLTYARIAAVPAVVLCLYYQEVPRAGEWLRWVALAIFIAAGVTDFLDGYFARKWGEFTRLRPHARSDRRQAPGSACLLMLVSDGTIRGGRCSRRSSSCAARSWCRGCASTSPGSMSGSR